MTGRFYDYKNRCCSHCKMLIDKQSFKYHRLSECFMIEMQNIKKQKEIEEFKEKEKSNL